MSTAWKKTSYEGEMTVLPIDDSNPFFTYGNPNLLYFVPPLCVNTCNKIVGRGAIDTAERGFNSVISTPFGVDLRDSTCE